MEAIISRYDNLRWLGMFECQAMVDVATVTYSTPITLIHKTRFEGQWDTVLLLQTKTGQTKPCANIGSVAWRMHPKVTRRDVFRGVTVISDIVQFQCHVIGKFHAPLH